MATTNPTGALDLAARRATVRQLTDEGHSARAIARRLGIHHKTVARDLAATPAPAEAPQTAPPTPTSGARPAPRLLHPLDPRTIQDLNVLADPRTGQLPAPLLRTIRAAADHRRAIWNAMAQNGTPWRSAAP
jgi:hypothetical protein